MAMTIDDHEGTFRAASAQKLFLDQLFFASNSEHRKKVCFPSCVRVKIMGKWCHQKKSLWGGNNPKPKFNRSDVRQQAHESSNYSNPLFYFKMGRYRWISTQILQSDDNDIISITWVFQMSWKKRQILKFTTVFFTTRNIDRANLSCISTIINTSARFLNF